MFRRLISNSIVRDTAKLVSGTAGGRLILLLSLPVVTRLYDPEGFRLLAVFTALVGTFSVIACLRTEIAVPLAENDDDAANLLAIALTSLVGVTLVLLALASTAPALIAGWVGTPEIAPYLWLVALSVGLTASYMALQFWATRMRRFGIIARTRVGQAAAGAGTMIGMGWLGFAPVGLLLGNMLSLGAGSLSLAVQAWRNDREQLRLVSWKRMSETFRQYKRYPIFSTPEALANIAGVQIPILIIAALSGSEAGQLFLAMQVMAAPLALVGASVGQVYASRATEELRNGTLYGFTAKMMRRLFLIGVGPMALAAIAAPFVFPIVFGAEWARAGVVVAWIAPWMLLQLMVSPVSMGLHVAGHQRTAMLLQFSGVFIRVVPLLFATRYAPAWSVEVFALTGIAFYTVYYLAVVGAVRLR